MHDLLVANVASNATFVKSTFPFSASVITAISILAVFTVKNKRHFFRSRFLHFFKKQKASAEQKMAIIAVIIGVTLILGFFVSWGLGLIAGFVILLAFLNGLSKGR